MIQPQPYLKVCLQNITTLLHEGTEKMRKCDAIGRGFIIIQRMALRY